MLSWEELLSLLCLLCYYEKCTWCQDDFDVFLCQSSFAVKELFTYRPGAGIIEVLQQFNRKNAADIPDSAAYQACAERFKQRYPL